MLSNAGDLALVIIGFGFVILVHELGHFLAARWAGVRVHDFAIGFGSAVVSWRKGLGFRRGTSHPEYRRLLAEAAADQGAPATGDMPPSLLPGVSPTEYRLNWLPFGGYVRMLGQEDLDPSARSGAPDSYNSKPVWKRMVIISAGVVMNVILAAVLYVVVFMVGLEMESPRIGRVGESGRAAAAVSAPQGAALEEQGGLRAGDTIVAINGNSVETFEDVRMRVAMSRGGQPVLVRIDRPGVGEVTLAVEATVGERTRLRELDALPAATARLYGAPEDASPEQLDALRAEIARMGLPGVDPGATLVRIGGDAGGVDGLELARAVERAGGAPVEAEFLNPGGQRVVIDVEPLPALEGAMAPVGKGAEWELHHLLGLAGPLTVGSASDEGRSAGLREGDIMARVGWTDWPDVAQGVRTIREHAGREVPLGLLREGERVSIEAPVSPGGMIGFNPGLMARAPAIVTGALGARVRASERVETGASSLRLAPGARLTSVGGEPVETWADVREALRSATEPARAQGEGATVALDALDPVAGEVSVEWTLSAGEVERLHALGWDAPFEPYALFDYERVMREASNPIEAIGMGVSETHRVMVTTYLTILRLTQGTVRVEHLKGPVGIAHLGTQVADRGLVWLVFFMAMVSVNLAVLNFLPLPIVDGGQFVFLAIEGVTGRPVSARVQGVAMLLGLALIGCVFLVVTFNDVRALFGAI